MSVAYAILPEPLTRVGDRLNRGTVDVPLVVDLDGTLIKTDSLHEAFLQLLVNNPAHAVRALLAARHGRAAFKSAVADDVLPDVTSMPIDAEVLTAIQAAKREGRKVYLATAADRRFADAIADQIGEFDGVLASENGTNLKGQNKADCLIATFGLHGFDYVGNSAADLPVWRAARRILVAGASPSLTRRLDRKFPNAECLSAQQNSVAPYVRLLRPHQWLKNSLLALPIIAAHDFSLASLLTIVIAIASFSLGASSIYIVNDMLDIPHDRAHVEKRHRPLAAGLVPINHALALLAVLSAVSVGLALTLPWMFLASLTGYLGFSLSYSFYLKRKLMIDVVALAALYGTRVVAGGAAAEISLSHWLVGFCFFMFLCLALVKRTAEMLALPKDHTDKIRGRGYRREDLPTVTALTAASGFVAVLVLALYISSTDVLVLYRHPDVLWGIGIVLTYWIGRVCVLTGRGEMRQDPVLFAATDRISLFAGMLVCVIFAVALG